MRQLRIIFLSIILSYYSNALSLSKEKKENILASTGLKHLLKMFKLHVSKRQVYITKPYTAADVICILLKR